MAKTSVALLLSSLLFPSCGGQAESTGVVNEAVGSPCVAGDEDRTDVGSFATHEVTVIDAAEPGTVCLYNHFRGRVSCPYGQSAADLALPEDAEQRCRTPAGQAVSVEVKPQLSRRRAEDSVYLSCRCDGPDPTATYCACPNDFACTPLLEDVGLGGAAGSYCVKAGTEFVLGGDYGPACDRAAGPNDPGFCG